jgi:catechol 2,3-dioxygenase-like lactoylglutathione lyase family enzyme
MTQQQKQPTCQDLVKDAWNSLKADIEGLLTSDPDKAREFLADLGYSTAQETVSDDEALEQAQAAFSEYGLALDYVEPNTFEGQREAYVRFQISFGGPSEEVRFFLNPDLSLHKAEFWYLDWFDGASTDITLDEATVLMCGWMDVSEVARSAVRDVESDHPWSGSF